VSTAAAPAAGPAARPSAAAQAPPRARPAPYADPYLAGVGIGIALLLAFVLAGRGLGASGAFDAAVVAGARTLAPSPAASLPYVAAADPTPFLGDWLVLEIVGVVIGAFASAALAGRLRLGAEPVPVTGSSGRLVQAFAGGVLMAVGARLARGCTSGLGLTGGATLSVGAWLFIATAFAAAFAVAPLVRRGPR
jgi:uncharacterized membrane protein YedE/YeeE